MAAKLKSLLKNPQSALVLKALIFGALLVWLKLWALPVILFLYLKPIFNTFSLLSSFMILLALAWALISGAADQSFFILAAGGLAFLFYLILGLKNLVFVNRWRWNYVLHLLLFYATFFLFFLADKSQLFFVKSLLVFLAAGMLFREFFKEAAEQFPKRRVLISWALALLILEAIWAISLLPIGFLNSANLAVLLVFVLNDLTVNHFKGTLNGRLVWQRMSLFAFLTLLIFATSRWSP